jgi:PAS domain S-box-containing protein
MQFTEEFYNTILGSLYDCVYFVDSARRILYWNKGAERITSFFAEEVFGAHCGKGILGHVNEQGVSLCEGECPLLKAIVHGNIQELEIYLHNREGNCVPVVVRAVPIKDHRGEIVGAVEIFSDNSSKMITLLY